MVVARWCGVVGVGAVVAVVGLGMSARAQTPAPTAQDVVQTSAEKSRGGTDPKYSDAAVNTPGAAGRVAPPQKGGERPRGGILTCDVHFDNRTKWKIKTWVDGNYEGVVGPFDDLYTYAIAGPTELYARADFTDGSTLKWGPVAVKCPAKGSFSWRLGN